MNSATTPGNNATSKKPLKAPSEPNHKKQSFRGKSEKLISPPYAGRQIEPFSEWEALSPSSRQEIETIIEVLKSVKEGDFSPRFPTNKGGILSRAGDLLNDIIGLNEHLTNEIVRVGKVVGQEGRMTERGSVGPAKGAWATSINSLNQLIGDLVAPTNEVARVITAVARGDLSQKMSLDVEGRPVRGEFLRIGTTVNSMVDQLNSFAAEVTRVAKEVGNEGKLGGQADVKGVSGTWKDLTDNVNQLAANLTSQVRAIAEVSTAVTKGDLTRSITVAAQGEVAALKDNINQMIANLKETTQKNAEQDWLKTNLARHARNR